MTETLSQLGNPTVLPASPDEAKLERVANRHAGTVYLVRFTAPEFTCLCPITGQPDFAELEISYIPNKLVLESKSLKLYLWTYREVGIFHEELGNELLEALDACLHSRWISVTGHFNVRGGIAITVNAERP